MQKVKVEDLRGGAIADIRSGEKMKTCKRCGLDFPMTAEYFHRNSSLRDRFDGSCKGCRVKQKESNDIPSAEYRKNYYENNKEKILANRKRYRGEHRELILLAKLRYQKLNGSKIYNRRKEKSAIYHAQWRSRNKERCRVAFRKYMSLRQSLPSTLTIEQWDAVKGIFGNKCAYCGKDKSLAQDHFCPISKGGEYTINNIVPACKSCNSSKSNKNFIEWYPGFKHYSRKREKKVMGYLNYKKWGTATNY